MPPENMCVMPYCLIPLTSTEPLWEWDLVSDAFFLTVGACKSLLLDEPPRHIAAFYKLLPQEAAAELAALHDGVRTGAGGSALECNYLCNGRWTHESLIVISRNSQGMATRMLGRLTTAPMINEHTVFSGCPSIFPQTGIWTLDARSGKVWHDSICADILGHGDAPSFFVPGADGLHRVHPSERLALQRHYRLLCQGRTIGDTITDVVRVRRASGEYAPIFVRASVMARDEEGRAITVTGIVAQKEPRQPDINCLSKDDRLFHALNSMGAGQWNWDTKTGAIYICPRYLAILGYGAEEGASFISSWRDYVHPDDREKVLCARMAIIENTDHGDTFESTYRMRRADGTWAWIFDRGFVTWRDSEGRAGHMIGSITNITTAQAERDRLEELVRHDTLTGLRTRAFCNLEIEHIEQNHIRPVSVISLDITGLKMVNDYLGHAMGDELLTRVAHTISSALRASDIIGRIGGDEFIILLPNCGEEKGKKLLAKVEAAFNSHNSGGHDMLPALVACGVASTENPDEPLAAVLAKADAAMYEKKKKARHRDHSILKDWIFRHTGKVVGTDERLD